MNDRQGREETMGSVNSFDEVRSVVDFDPKRLFDSSPAGSAYRRAFRDRLDDESLGLIRQQIETAHAQTQLRAFPANILHVRLFGSVYDAESISWIGPRPWVRPAQVREVKNGLLYAHSIEIEDPVALRLKVPLTAIDNPRDWMVEELFRVYTLRDLIEDGSVRLVAPSSVKNLSSGNDTVSMLQAGCDRRDVRQAILHALPDLPSVVRLDMFRQPSRPAPDLIGPIGQSSYRNTLRKKALIRAISGSYILYGEILPVAQDLDEIIPMLQMSTADAWMPRPIHLRVLKALALATDRPQDFLSTGSIRVRDHSSLNMIDIVRLRRSSEVFAAWRDVLATGLRMIDNFAERGVDPAKAARDVTDLLRSGAFELDAAVGRDWKPLSRSVARSLFIGCSGAAGATFATGAGPRALAAPAVAAMAGAALDARKLFTVERSRSAARRLFASISFED